MLSGDKFKINKKDLMWGVAIMALIIGASYVRYTLLDTHFSHCDDLIPAQHLPVENSRNLSNVIDYAMMVAHSSTYAPLQFLLTGSITDRGMSYQDILFWGRFPSFLMTLFSFVVVFFISKKIYQKEFLLYSIIPILILGFSWEDIIYSVQSESYTISLLAVLLLFLLFFSLLKKEKISLLTSITLGLILGLSIYSSYQFLLFLPGFFLALLSKYFSDAKISLKVKDLREHPISTTLQNVTKVTVQFIKDFYPTIIIVTFSFITLFNLFLHKVASRGLNWNTGVNNEFLFDNNPKNSLLDRIGHLITFFIENTLIVFNSIISIAQETNPLNDVYVIISFILFIIGVRSFYKSKQTSKKHFFNFFMTTMIIWVVLTLAQKITLSPTRHSLVLLSFVLIFVPEGIYSVFQKLKTKEHIKKIVVGVFTLFSLLTFATSYTTIVDERLDKFHPEEIETLIQKYNISEIYAYNYTWQTQNMKYINVNFPQQNRRWPSYFSHKNQQEGNILFITHRCSPLDDRLIEKFTKDSKRDTFQGFEILFKKEICSDTEIDFSNKTKNGTNSILYYIVKPHSNK